MPEVLTTSSSIMCPHGGQAILTTANSRVYAQQAQILLESDEHSVTGCSFTLPGPKYSPCVRIQWSAGSTHVVIDDTPVLLRNSVGQCLNAEGATQGVATIGNTQTRVSAI